MAGLLATLAADTIIASCLSGLAASLRTKGIQERFYSTDVQTFYGLSPLTSARFGMSDCLQIKLARIEIYQVNEQRHVTGSETLYLTYPKLARRIRKLENLGYKKLLDAPWIIGI
jgi:hypothetical protein